MSGRANSSNGASRLARIIARDTWFAAGRPKAAAPAAPIPREPPFLPEDWREQAQIREAVDAINSNMRWRISITVGDGCLRTFYLCGPHDDCLKRARAMFPTFESVSLEPAGISGIEVIDRRLSTIGV